MFTHSLTVGQASSNNTQLNKTKLWFTIAYRPMPCMDLLGLSLNTYMHIRQLRQVFCLPALALVSF